MKKAILGTTALVAVSALAVGNASAADKIKLGVGGYMMSTYYYADYDKDKGTDSSANLNRIDDRVTQEGEVIFTGSTTLDNGLKFGVNIQLEARQEKDQVDETYIYVDGAFGRVLFGSEDSVAYLMHYAAPSPVPMYSADSANIRPAGAGSSTRPTLFGDSDKITYFTPRFGGFQLGASYVPDGSSETGVHSPYASTKIEDSTDQGYSLAANYVNKFGGVDLAVSAGYQRADTAEAVPAAKAVPAVAGLPAIIPTDITVGREKIIAADAVDAIPGGGMRTEDTSEYSLGAQIGVAGFTVGGGYRQQSNIGGAKDSDKKTWSLGAKYGMGPWAVGVQYSKGTTDVSGKADTSLENWVIGGQYTLGPGITAFGGVELYDNELIKANGTPNGIAGDSTIFFVGTTLSF